jgi:hypothetical protein
MSKSSITRKTTLAYLRSTPARSVLFSVGLVLVLAGGLTACGSSAAKTSTTTAGGGAPDSAAPSGSGGTSPATVKATGGGDFCKLIAASYNAAQSSAIDTSPAALKKLYQGVQEKYRQAVDSAPTAIKGDVEILDAASSKLTAALAAANYDMAKLATGATADFSTPKVLAASTHVQAYVKDQCGIDLAGAAAASATTAP